MLFDCCTHYIIPSGANIEISLHGLLLKAFSDERERDQEKDEEKDYGKDCATLDSQVPLHCRSLDV